MGVLLLGLCGSALALRGLFFTGPYRQADGRTPAGEIVDIHAHAAGIGIGSQCYVSPALRDSYKFGIYLESFGVTRADLEEHGDALVIQRIAEGVAASEHVDRAIVLALDGS